MARTPTRSVGAIRSCALSRRCCQRAPTDVYFCAFLQFRPRVTPAMEINPILNAIKDLTSRTQSIRGYL
jgi:hypothetical protein